jgi:predicted nucleic acid-binding protein
MYTNNFSTITEIDIMANLYEVISRKANWKTEIENIHKTKQLKIYLDLLKIVLV